MQLQAARFSRDKPDTVHESRDLVEQDVGRARDIDHPVIGCQKEPLRATQICREIADPGVQLLEQGRPVGRRATNSMCRRVELGHVEVDDRALVLVQDRSSGRKPVGDRRPGSPRRAAEYCRGETGSAIPLGGDDERRNSDIRGALEHRGGSLPGSRVDPRVPAAELIHHPVVRGVEDGIADKTVDSGRYSRGQGREGCRGRGREARIDRRPTGDLGSDRARVPSTGRQRLRPQAVNEQDDRPIHRGQPEGVRLMKNRFEATRKNVGKAPPAGFRRR